MANRGDTIDLILNISIDGNPIEEGYADDIEIQFNYQSETASVKKLLSNEDIYWSETQGKYALRLSQKDTFRLSEEVGGVQCRIYRNGVVISSTIKEDFNLGDVLSRKVLE